MKLLWKPGAVFTLDVVGKLYTAIIDEKHNNPSANFTPSSNVGRRLLSSEEGDTIPAKIRGTGERATMIVVAIAGERIKAPIVTKVAPNKPHAKPPADKSVKHGTTYINHCWKCGASISSHKNKRCSKCNLFKCGECGMCMCKKR